MKHRFHSIVWMLYDGIEQISQIVWKVDGMK